MKKFLVKLKNGFDVNMEASAETELWNKIKSGHYKCLPVRGKAAFSITEDLVAEIMEITGKTSNE